MPPVIGPNTDRLKQQFDEITENRTLNDLGSGVAAEDTDGDNDPKAAHAKASGGGKGAGAKGKIGTATGGMGDTAGGGHVGAFGGAGNHTAMSTGADLQDNGPHSGGASSSLQGEIDDLAGSSVGADATTSATGATAGSTASAATATGQPSGTGSSASTAAGAQTTGTSTSTTADGTSAASSATATDANSTSTDAQTVSASAQSALSSLGISDTDPGVKAAEQKLYGDLHAAVPDAASIKQDTDNLISAMKSAGLSSTSTASVINKMTLDPTASVNGSAMALVEAAQEGINTDDSNKDQAAEQLTKAQIDRKQQLAQAQAQAAKALAASQAAEQQAQAQQSQQKFATQQNQQQSSGQDGGVSNSGGGSSGTGSTGGGGGSTSGTGGGGTTQSSTVQAPAGAAAGVTGAGHGTAIPWNQFQEKSYGSPTPMNHEEETYTTNGQNFTVNSDGSATIKATWNGSAYNSARIEGPKVGNLPQYISAVMKNPSAQGTWPAFWLCGPNWPVGGEVDMMEQVNGGNLVQSTHHGTQTGDDTQHTSTTVDGIPLNSQYNEIGAYLTDQGVQFYVNGKLTKTVDMASQDPNWASDASNMSIIANLAMGGDWPGHAPNTGDQTMEIKGIYRSDTPPS